MGAMIFRELIQREEDRAQLRRLLLEGAGSPPSGEADASYFEDLRAYIRAGE
jgi:antitoxin ParD1/3/4